MIGSAYLTRAGYADIFGTLSHPRSFCGAFFRLFLGSSEYHGALLELTVWS
jgi:hypothetical protein